MLLRLLLVCACAAFCQACSCLRPSYPQDYCRHEILFKGEALSETREGGESVGLPLEGSDREVMVSPQIFTRVYTVKVKRAFAMPSSLRSNKTLTMKTSSQSAACGVTFPLEKTRLFAGYLNSDGEVRTNLCAPNLDWKSVQKKKLLKKRLSRYCKRLEKKNTINIG